MPVKICLSTANTLTYPQGGHLWVFINWALGLKSCGCEVTWLDVVPTTLSLDELTAGYEHLRKTLRPFGLHANLVVDFLSSEDLTDRLQEAALPCFKNFDRFDLLVDLRYDLPERLFTNFRRKVLIDIDPGQYQLALVAGAYPEPKHDLLFSIGETAGQNGANERWLYTPPCVFLDEWPFTLGSNEAPWTTVAHWWGDCDEAGEAREDNKREGFRPFMTIPSNVRARFELALNIEHEKEQELIESYGFKVHDAHTAVSTPVSYRSFIQRSAGEFSCAKPSYVKLQTGWLSDRTLCYLATGRPCVVQNTGPSRFLPINKGLHRFSDLNEAAKAIGTVMANYESESRTARSLAEEFFDAHKVCGSLLSRAL
jgi:hypothetical protein